jgi:hypothetical protein
MIRFGLEQAPSRPISIRQPVELHHHHHVAGADPGQQPARLLED